MIIRDPEKRTRFTENGSWWRITLQSNSVTVVKRKFLSLWITEIPWVVYDSAHGMNTAWMLGKRMPFIKGIFTTYY